MFLRPRAPPPMPGSWGLPDPSSFQPRAPSPPKAGPLQSFVTSASTARSLAPHLLRNQAQPHCRGKEAGLTETLSHLKGPAQTSSHWSHLVRGGGVDFNYTQRSQMAQREAGDRAAGLQASVHQGALWALQLPPQHHPGAPAQHGSTTPTILPAAAQGPLPVPPAALLVQNLDSSSQHPQVCSKPGLGQTAQPLLKCHLLTAQRDHFCH